jgi:N4-gp56 family major capsid protein
MTIQVVTAAGGARALTNSIRTQYVADYLRGANVARLYDQLSVPIGRPMSELNRGSDVQHNFLSDMEPGTSAISEVTDLTPQALRDATVSVTPTSRAEALQTSENLQITAYTNFNSEWAYKVGKNMMETVDILARDVATQGDFVIRKGVTARTALDAGSTGHRASQPLFMEYSGYIQQFKIPGFVDAKNGQPNWMAIMHPFVYHDILQSSNVLEVAQYQNQSILFNHELGSLSGFRLVVSPWAKVFYGAGADHATSNSTTLAVAETALSTTISLASTSSCDKGAFLNILDTRETANTHVGTNERVRYVSRSAKVVTIIGEGENGGLRFDHASGVTVSNNDSAYTIVVGGRDSLVKVYAPEVGLFGQIVGPRREGTVDQWWSLGWKFYGNYGRLRENGLLRGEVSVSIEA